MNVLTVFYVLLWCVSFALCLDVFVQSTFNCPVSEMCCINITCLAYYITILVKKAAALWFKISKMYFFFFFTSRAALSAAKYLSY